MFSHQDAVESNRIKWRREHKDDSLVVELSNLSKLLNSVNIYTDEVQLDIVQNQALYLANIFDAANTEHCSACGSKDPNGIGSCCKNCRQYRGHFENSIYQVTHELRQKYEKMFKFDPKLYGYIDPEKKICKLPRILRSSTCLNYSCYSIMPSTKWEDNAKVKMSVHIMKAVKLLLRMPC